MANIKKAFQPVMSLLAANMDASVSEIYDQAVELTSAKTGGGGSKATAHHRDEDGNVVAIRCGYFGLWMNPETVEFGKKASSPTGLNSMCKAGVSAWTSQQREASKAKEQLLVDLQAGEITSDDIAGITAEIEAARTAVAELPEGVEAYESLEDLLATL